MTLAALSGCIIGDDDSGALPKDGRRCAGFGVSFSGPAYADDEYFWYSSLSGEGGNNRDVRPIALGGTEQVGTTPSLGSGETLDSSDTLLAVGSNNMVTGTSVGASDLCVVDGNGTVIDGTEIAVRPVDHAVAVPGTDEPWPWSPANIEPTDAVASYPLASWAMFAGTARRVGVGLVSEEGWRLVDQGLVVELSNDGIVIPSKAQAWDEAIADLNPGHVDVRATLSSGQVVSTTVLVVDKVDRVEVVPADSYHPFDKLLEGYGQICFRAHAGDAQVIQGAWEFELPEMMMPVTNPSWVTSPNCIEWTAMTPGSGEVVARLGGVEARQAVTVVPSGQ